MIHLTRYQEKLLKSVASGKTIFFTESDNSRSNIRALYDLAHSHNLITSTYTGAVNRSPQYALAITEAGKAYLQEQSNV